MVRHEEAVSLEGLLCAGALGAEVLRASWPLPRAACRAAAPGANGTPTAASAGPGEDRGGPWLCPGATALSWELFQEALRTEGVTASIAITTIHVKNV